jgi:predicted ATPase
MIKRIHITGFKSLTDVTVDLDPVTVFVGRTGAGKSNFIEAIRWLRDYLTQRNEHTLQVTHGNWNSILSATSPRPATLSFGVTFCAPRIAEDYRYLVRFAQQGEQPPTFTEEKLELGSRVLYHQAAGKWISPPPLGYPPPAGAPALGGLTGLQEATIAHLILTTGIGCYSFPDRVLTQPQVAQANGAGLFDDASNFLQALTAIVVNVQTWHHLRGMAAAIRPLQPRLKTIDLSQPQHDRVIVTHQAGERLLVFDLAQESEGFRRLLACLLALYQTPPKQILLFDEPEKGMYPAGLAVLAEEFKGHAREGRGQVLLTTHSPQFLDHFGPEQIRVVEMREHATHIGHLALDQTEALREHLLRPGELLTTDEARLALAGAE